MTVSDKRRHFRKALRTEASIADVLGNTWSEITCLNISRNGVAFIASTELPAGSSRTIKFQLPNEPRHITAVCKVIHCAAHSYLPGFRIGAEFVRIDHEDVELIDNFVGSQSDDTS